MITLNRSPASLAAELRRIKADVVSEINAAAGSVRARYITAIAGQDMIYREKEREALAYLSADPAPVDLSAFPFLSVEAAALGVSVYQLAQIVLFKADEWRAIGPELEALRVASIAAVEVAPNALSVWGAQIDFNKAIEGL